MLVCVRQSVCPFVRLLHNSKTMKPRGPKLCLHTKGTPRWCMSEFKHPLRRSLTSLFNEPLSRMIRVTSMSLAGVLIHHFFGLLNNAMTWKRPQWFLNYKLLFITFLIYIIECLIIILMNCWEHYNVFNARRHQCLRW